MRAFKKEYQGDAEDHVVLRILGEWLEERGLMPVSWETLINTLRGSGLSALADQILSTPPETGEHLYSQHLSC